MYERNSVDCPNGFSDKLIYRTGYASSGNCNGAESDPAVFTTMLRHMNYDYLSSTTKYCGDAGEPPCQGSDAGRVLPASLYLPAKPAWWGTRPWPAIGPDLSAMSSDIPAKARFWGTAAAMPDARFGPGAVDPLNAGPARIASSSAGRLLEIDPRQAGHVRIRIYDAHGALVKTLADRVWGAGPHAFSWQTGQGGVFFVRVDADGRTGAVATAVAR